MPVMSSTPMSWGRHPRVWQNRIVVHDRFAPLPRPFGQVLPHGNGRSYGDSCQLPEGTLLAMRGLDRFIDFDPERGILRCEAGVLLADIIDLVLPHGWFPAVTPGTRFVTVGGAIANDVHGKNHHAAGSFADHVNAFELLRTDGQRLSVRPGDPWFAATVGGLGLTGAITWAELRLRRVAGPWLVTHTLEFGDLDEFIALSAVLDGRHEYTVAWVDCCDAAGSGLFMTGDHFTGPATGERPGRSRLTVPITPPFSLVNRLTLAPFNRLYRRKHRGDGQQLQHYQPFFYPLDAIGHWNRLYGPAGFLQYQCVIPPAATPALKELFHRVAASGVGSPLAVLKRFGDRQSHGLMSFPRPGFTLALDFPNTGGAVHDLLRSLDEIVVAAGGAVYPAKDARMSAPAFRRYFPHWESFMQFKDPLMSSGLWRRVAA